MLYKGIFILLFFISIHFQSYCQASSAANISVIIVNEQVGIEASTAETINDLPKEKALLDVKVLTDFNTKAIAAFKIIGNEFEYSITYPSSFFIIKDSSAINKLIYKFPSPEVHQPVAVTVNYN